MLLKRQETNFISFVFANQEPVAPTFFEYETTTRAVQYNSWTQILGYCKVTQMKGCCRKRETAVPRFLQVNKPTVYSLDLKILRQRFG